MGVAYAAYLFVLPFWAPVSYLSMFVVIHTPFFLLVFFEFVLRKYRVFYIRRHICGFLSLVILKMHVGHSFRDALQWANRENDPFMQSKWNKIIGSVVFSKQPMKHEHRFLTTLVQNLKSIDEQSHLSLQGVQNLRRKYEIEDEFLHRSRQALYQTRAQSFIMFGMYVAAFGFMVMRYGFHSMVDIFMISLGLFFSGFMGTLLLGRKMRWKH